MGSNPIYQGFDSSSVGRATVQGVSLVLCYNLVTGFTGRGGVVKENKNGNDSNR